MQILLYAYQNHILNEINLLPPEDARYCLGTPYHP